MIITTVNGLIRKSFKICINYAIIVLYFGSYYLFRFGLIENRVEFRKAKKRSRINPEISTEKFFKELLAREVNYVVLRWYEDLPNAREGRDIDILLDDKDLPKIVDLTTTWPVGRKCDIYTTTGLAGFDHKGTPLFPPTLAKQILSGAQLYKSIIRTPADRDHLLALAYHAIYIKGPKSGLASELPIKKYSDASHDYAEVLVELGRRIGLELPQPVTMESLDGFLMRHGWRPPEEMLERLADQNEWLAKRLVADADLPAGLPAGLVIFFIRQRGIEAGLKEPLVKLIEAKGFEILSVETIQADSQIDIARQVRGGNWGRGPWPVSGGEPAVVVAAFDILPTKLAIDEIRKFPLCDNRRLLFAKSAARRLMKERIEAQEQFNPLHSTDNADQAWRFVRRFMPHTQEALCAKIEELVGQFETLEPVVRQLSNHGTRAKVELVSKGNSEIVKKTFKNMAIRHLNREVAFLTTFSHRSEVPKLLGSGENYLLLPYYDNCWNPRWRTGVPRLLPLKIVRQIADFFKTSAALGYDLIDVSPRRNIILDRSEGLKVLDFEFAYHHPNPVLPERCYSITGIPNDFPGDYPPAVDYIKRPYAKEWYPFVGLGPKSLFYDSPQMQVLKRAVNYPLFVLRWSVSKALFSKRGVYGLARKTYRRLRRG